MGKQQKPAVFVFTTAYHPIIGGAEIAIENVANRLKDEFNFFIITWRARRDLLSVEDRPEGRVIRIGFPGELGKLILPFWGTVRVLWLMRRERPRLFWPVMASFASGIPYLVNIVRFWHRVPVVLTLQEGDAESHIAEGRWGFITMSWRAAFRRTDVLTAISRYLRELAIRYGYLGLARVIPNGVDTRAFQGSGGGPRKSRSPVVITVSRLVPKNGVDILVRAVAAARKSVPDLQCHIIGAGPELARLEALQSELRLGDAIKFFGEVPHGAVQAHLAAADMFVRPSRSEGMGNAFVEALASGLPIIGTPVGGIPDIIRDGETGLFCRPDDPADCAEKIIRLIRDPALSRKIVANGQALVRERFEWDGIARSYAGLFRNVLARPLRVLIATPLFPPAIGGPARVSEKLAQSFTEAGCRAAVLSYGNQPERSSNHFTVHTVSPRLPSGVKHLMYFIRAFGLARRSDVVLALDPVIVGFPVAIACRLLKRPFLLRVEGDFLWEWHVERTRRDITLAAFNAELDRQPLSTKEQIMRSLARCVFRRASCLVVSSRWRLDILDRAYGISEVKTAIIEPPWPEVRRGSIERSKTLMFAGRFIHVKNIERLIRAFARFVPEGWRLLLIGDGPERNELGALIAGLGTGERIRIVPPVPEPELRTRIASAHAFLLPSLSDVSPNVILDCIAGGTPFLLTAETGFHETLKNVGLFVDPLSEEDIGKKLRQLVDPKEYKGICEKLDRFRKNRSFGKFAGEWLDLIRQAV